MAVLLLEYSTVWIAFQKISTLPLTEEFIKQLLRKRIGEIDLDAAKNDVRPFLRDPSQLDLWSVDFFHHWIGHLRFDKVSAHKFIEKK